MKVKRREHATRDSDLERSTSALGHRTGEMWSKLAGENRLLCPHENELQMPQHNTNVSSENNLCRLRRGGFSQIAIVPLRRSRHVSETIWYFSCAPKTRAEGFPQCETFRGTAISKDRKS